MKHAGLSLALAFALTACVPPQSGAEATVRGIYDEVQQHIGGEVTPTDSIPMTDDLIALLERAEAAADARGEPFIDGDLAANCQDCQSLTGLEIGPQTGPEPVPAQSGHTLLEARFVINGNEERAVIYDLVQTSEGWRVDNILAEGFDLRAEAQSYLAEASAATSAAAPPSP
ncbi:MAG TPA: hypothetical protein VEA80_14240 [Vitreimonas sp.]|uniref:hypothetical protein n=1 Tax=Vitreimonas sp. TaxID=3069702 RepID=UPI002D74A97C|nr:hypothetical protein [Vitreimonas sp.]HYD88630.1 hypothetical protein [Vitreimonas sp.]